MREIELTQGYKAIVDDEDYDRLATHAWQAAITQNKKNHTPKVYAIYSMWAPHRKSKKITVRMHRVIVDAKPGDIVDHINGNTLDNRKSNLRIVSAQHNACNRKPHLDRQFKGVYWHQGQRRYKSCWAAMIRVSGKAYHLGTYKTPEEAARAYDAAAIKFYGEFARVNFPSEVKVPA